MKNIFNKLPKFAGGGGVILTLLVFIGLMGYFFKSCNKNDFFNFRDTQIQQDRLTTYKNNLIQWNDTIQQKAKLKRADILKSGSSGNIKAFNDLQKANQQIIQLAENPTYANMQISLDSANFVGLNFTLYYNPQNGQTIKMVTMNSLEKHKVIYVEYLPTIDHFLSNKSIYDEFCGIVNLYNNMGKKLGTDEFKNGINIKKNKKVIASEEGDLDGGELETINLPPGRRGGGGGGFGFFGGTPSQVQDIQDGGGGGGPNPQDPQRPCPGDPVSNPRIVPTTVDGDNKSGRNGKTRSNEKQYHDGTDIGCPVGDPFYAMYDGVVDDKFKNSCPTDIPDEACGGRYGNYITIKSIINGQTIYIKYNHLSTILYRPGQQVVAGQQLGTCGKTGNAWKVPYPHIHIQAREEGFGDNWSDKATNKLNPESFLTQKFNQNGLPIIKQPCN